MISGNTGSDHIWVADHYSLGDLKAEFRTACQNAPGLFLPTMNIKVRLADVGFITSNVFYATQPAKADVGMYLSGINRLKMINCRVHLGDRIHAAF